MLHVLGLIESLGSRARKVDVRLPGKGDSTSHGARPVHLIITMIKWIRTSRLSIKNSLTRGHDECPFETMFRVLGPWFKIEGSYLAHPQRATPLAFMIALSNQMRFYELKN